MNLKIEDLEKNNPRTGGNSEVVSVSQSQSRKFETDIDAISVASKNLIQQSMKDALLHMIENKETASAHKHQKSGEPGIYEKIIQKLEADIRGHIRLEHEMKIHMDYLEGKVEKFENEQKSWEDKIKASQSQLKSFQDKYKFLNSDREEKEKELKKIKKTNEELRKKIQELTQKNDKMSL